jgi:cytochrome oxidase Cu insertion factor (SCO1/SenC/PrrC family)
MLVKITFLLLLSVSFAHAPAFAQLGPKAGAGQSATDLDRVKVGQPAPDFTLENMDGKPVSLSDYRGKKNVILVFYRGQW